MCGGRDGVALVEVERKGELQSLYGWWLDRWTSDEVIVYKN